MSRFELHLLRSGIWGWRQRRQRSVESEGEGLLWVPTSRHPPPGRLDHHDSLLPFSPSLALPCSFLSVRIPLVGSLLTLLLSVPSTLRGEFRTAFAFFLCSVLCVRSLGVWNVMNVFPDCDRVFLCVVRSLYLPLPLDPTLAIRLSLLRTSTRARRSNSNSLGRFVSLPTRFFFVFTVPPHSGCILILAIIRCRCRRHYSPHRWSQSPPPTPSLNT